MWQMRIEVDRRNDRTIRMKMGVREEEAVIVSVCPEVYYKPEMKVKLWNAYVRRNERMEEFELVTQRLAMCRNKVRKDLSHVRQIIDSENEVLRNNSDVMERQKSYFEELLNEENVSLRREDGQPNEDVEEYQQNGSSKGCRTQEWEVR